MVGLWRAGGPDVVAPPAGGAPPDPVPPAPRPAVGPAAARLPEVRVEATLLTPLFAPPQEQGLAVRSDGEPLPARVVAGAGAGFDVDRARRGSALVSVAVGSGSLLRHVATDPAAAAPVVVGARVEVRGVVVDAQQRPARGASVWFGELTAEGSERAFEVDEDGAFTAEVSAGQGVPFVARGPGLASVWRVVEVRPGTAGLRAVLPPAATVHVQLAGRAVEVEQARAFVVPLEGQVSSAVAQWPFFAQVRSDGYPFDADGRAVVPDLPMEGEVGVVVRHPLAPLAAPARVALGRSRQRVTVPIAFEERAVTGTLVDARGEPVAGAWLFGRTPNRSLGGERSPRLLPPHLALQGVFVARSDRRGRFSVGVPHAADAQVAVRCVGFAGCDLDDVRAAPDATQELQLADWHGGDASLRVTPPVDASAWRLRGFGVEVACGPGDAGVLALPRCGRYRLRLEVFVGERAPVALELPDVAVTGPVELPSAR